jgi:hypothetical protein
VIQVTEVRPLLVLRHKAFYASRFGVGKGVELLGGATAWVSSSAFLGRFKIQWHFLSRWLTNVEINISLFVAFGVLLSPQNQQKRRKLRKDNLSSGGPSRDIPHRERSSDATETCPVPDDGRRDRDHRTLQAYPSRSKTCSRRPPKYSASCRFSV